MQLFQVLHIADMDNVSYETSSPVDESRTRSYVMSSRPFEFQSINETNSLEEERRNSGMEEELYKFYETLSEKAFDLSMTDLVILKPACATDGLPVEDNSAQITLKDPSPTQTEPEADVACHAKKKLSSWLLIPEKLSSHPSPGRTSTQESVLLFPSQVPEFSLSESTPSNVTSRTKAFIPDNSAVYVRSLSSKSHRKQSARISPKVTPMSSPRSSSVSANFANGVNMVQAPRNSVTSNARQKIPGIRMDANNQCSICSSYTQFFKSRCEVCGRIYCSSCMQEAVLNNPHGTRCRGVCAERPSRRSIRKSATSCWPFGSKKFVDDDV